MYKPPSNTITVTLKVDNQSCADCSDERKVKIATLKFKREVESIGLYIESCETKFDVRSKRPNLVFEEFKNILKKESLTLGDDPSRPPIFNPQGVRIGSVMLSQTNDGTTIITTIFEGGYKGGEDDEYNWSVRDILKGGDYPSRLVDLYNFYESHECNRGCSHIWTGGLW